MFLATGLFVNTDTFTTNPFREIVEHLGDDWRKVSLEYLDWVAARLRHQGVPLETYGDIFRVLEWLHERGAVELQHNDNEHLIKRKQYLGKNF